MLFGIAVFLLSFALAVGEAVAAEVDDPVTLENVGNPGKNDPNEPLAEKFSAAKAALWTWHRSAGRKRWPADMTCHTNYLYLLSAPRKRVERCAGAWHRSPLRREIDHRSLAGEGPTLGCRSRYDRLDVGRQRRRRPGKLHPLTRQALDRIWTVQREDGGFDWYKVCHWPPYEDDDYFGARWLRWASESRPRITPRRPPRKKA